MNEMGTTVARLPYEIFGPEDGPTLLLIQGLGAQMVGWNPGFIQELTNRGFQVVIFDNRDIGQADKFPGQSYTVSDMAHDTVALLDELGLDKVHVLGQSMGGMIAQELSIRWPERVETLTLFFTSGSTDHVIGSDTVAERESVPPATNREEFIERYVKGERPCSSEAYPQDTEWLAELGGLLWDRCQDVSGGGRQIDAVNQSSDRRPYLKNISFPTLMVCGTADQLISPEGSKELHELIPNSELEIFTGMGHEFPQDLRPTFANLLVAHTKKTEAEVA